ncbi:hypothetical protein HDV06_002085 [Boothiomyces sp. JEL0866]|nr:hypothetical protein HDV06_002085 [Boothiomyces sp. JEL0866]
MNIDDIFKQPEQTNKRVKLDSGSARVTDLDQQLSALIDQGEKVAAVIDLPILKKLVTAFNRALQKNTLQRSKYAGDPMKYIESEADLVEAIKNLTSISSAPELYPALIELDCLPNILSLLSHENTDISIQCVELLNELVDEDLAADEEGVDLLVQKLVKLDTLELLVANLSRLDDTRLDDKQGIFNTLSVFENFISVSPELDTKIFNTGKLLDWLLERIGRKEFDSVRQYCSELLSILVTRSEDNRTKLVEKDGIEILLQVLASYIKKDPQEGEEVELMENCFDILCLILHHEKHKKLFMEGEGIQLMLIMIKQKKMAKMRAFKTLSHLMLGDSAEAAEQLVELSGLGSVFSAFMKKSDSKYKKLYPDYSQKDQEEHVVSIIASLFQSLSPDTVQRLIYKFIENDYEKLHRLILLHDQYKLKIQMVDAGEEDEEYFDLLEAGLYTLQMIDLVMLFLITKSPEIQKVLPELLGTIKESLDNVINVLQVYCENLDEGKEKTMIADMIAMIDSSSQ